MPAPKELQRRLRAKWPAILALLASGESLRSICRDEKMPDFATVMRWLKKDESGGMREQYVRARQNQAEFLADEILEIADDARNDWMEKKTRSGGTVEVLNQEHVQRSRLRIDTRKWIASKLYPRVYGDRVDVNHSGEVSSRIVLGVPLQRPGGARLGAGDLGAARIAAEAEVAKSTELVESGEAPRLPGESSPPTDEDVPE